MRVIKRGVLGGVTPLTAVCALILTWQDDIPIAEGRTK